MKIAIFGAAGIIGQHMRLCVPDGVVPIYCRREADMLHRGVDITTQQLYDFLAAEKPDVVINLAGENRPDVVEKDPLACRNVNVQAPAAMAVWCQHNGAHMVQVSSQAVFGGDGTAPYEADGWRLPVNSYGAQKLIAEQEVKAACHSWTIARPTFVLGVRPMPLVGRENPVEQMLSPDRIIVDMLDGEVVAKQRHVNNRWFSVSFARDVAAELWQIAMHGPQRRAINIGIPFRVSRYDIAKYLRPDCEPVAHEDLPGLAPRPMDTTYAGEGGSWERIQNGLENCRRDYAHRERLAINQRAKELAIFTGTKESVAADRLTLGFGRLHNAVSDDWRRVNPQTDAEILEWYRTTDAYLWELTAYHLDPGFNYSGMCEGIAVGLKNKGVERVLCLGDGIGDLTLKLAREGFDAGYNDLLGSRTSEFAAMRIWMYHGPQCWRYMTSSWDPELPRNGEMDAVVTLDFLEHVTDVEAWVRAIYAALKPGGWLVAQNAFACGSGPDGPMPMHLARNDRFEKDWDPLLTAVGFVQESSNWYRRSE